MRVLYYVPCLEVGGTEKVVHDLAVALPRDRFEVTVLWSCYWGPLGEKLLEAGVPVRHLPFNEARRFAEVVEGIREIQPDIFHSFSYRKEDRDVRAGMEAGVRTIITARGDIRHWDPAQSRQEWEVFRNAGAQRITTCSDAIADVVRRVEGVRQEQLCVIYNGVTMPGSASEGPTLREELGIGAGETLLGYVGNYRPEKGHLNLLPAFRKVLDTRPGARLVCCGGGAPRMKPAVEARAKELDLADSSFLLDLQMNVGRVYRDLDLYVHPSDCEGFSNSLLEAMAHGLPIVATRVGGTVEAIRHGEQGLLVPARDPEALAAAIETLLADREMGARLGHAAQELVRERFQFHHMLNGYTRLYEEEFAKQ